MIKSSIHDHVNARNARVPEGTREARLQLDTTIVITGAGLGRPQFVGCVAIEDMSQIGCRLETRADSGYSEGDRTILQADGHAIRSKTLPNETLADSKFPLAKSSPIFFPA